VLPHTTRPLLGRLLVPSSHSNSSKLARQMTCSLHHRSWPAAATLLLHQVAHKSSTCHMARLLHSRGCPAQAGLQQWHTSWKSIAEWITIVMAAQQAGSCLAQTVAWVHRTHVAATVVMVPMMVLLSAHQTCFSQQPRRLCQLMA
jgi:hypothetical protein